jgi:hypothetical protein
MVTPSSVFIYDYITDSWWRDSLPNITALGEVVDVVAGGTTWSNVTTDWDTETRTWASIAGTTVPSIFAGREDGATFLVDESIGFDYFAIGSIMDRYIETEDYYFPSKYIGEGDPLATGTVYRLVLFYTWLGFEEPFEVAASFDRGNTWTTKLITPNETGMGYVDYNATGNVIRFRFRESAANTFFRWRHYVMDFTPSGDSVPAGLGTADFA